MSKIIILTIFLSIVIIGIIFSISNSEKHIEDSVNTPDKDISEIHEIGNIFDNGLKSGMTSTILDNGNQKASIRFTNSISGKVNAVTLSVSSNSQQQVTIGIQEDDGHGNPTGQWLSEKAVNKTIVSKELDRTFTFSENVMIQENQIYHIVLESENANNLDYLKIKHYLANTPHQPYNKSNPDLYLSDPSINSLYFDGKKWHVEEKWPSFLVSFVDGKKIGQPYTLAAGWVIRDKTWVGQTIIPSSDYNISKISFVVGKEGNPDQPLYYGIQDEDGNILSNGFFTESNQLSWRNNWVGISLEEPLFLKSEKLYRIYLYSSIPKTEEFYRIYGHEYSFDYDIGYGELRHRLTISHDGGKIWSAWKDADTIFKLTT